MEMLRKIWIIKNRAKTLLVLLGLLFLIIFKYYLLDNVIFKNENAIINSYYSNGENFVTAIKNNHKDEINIFLEENKVDINYVDSKKATSLLIWALLYKNYTLSTELINRGADVNSISPENGLSALHIAAADGCNDCVYMLIAKGADANARDKKRRYRPLDFAVEKKRSKVVEYLTKITTN